MLIKTHRARTIYGRQGTGEMHEPSIPARKHPQGAASQWQSGLAIKGHGAPELGGYDNDLWRHSSRDHAAPRG